MKVFIVEDERLGLDRLIKLLQEVDPDITVIGYVETVKSAIWWLENNPAPDIIFMDIELADGQCFEIFNKIEVKSPIIFTTSYDEYALRAFKVNSVDYLLKPVRREDLAQSLNKYRSLKSNFVDKDLVNQNIEKLISGLQSFQQPKEYRKRFLVKQGQKLLSVEIDDIAWFSADGKLCFIRTWKNNRFIIDYTLEQLTDMLDPEEFFRVNRSYLVNIRSIVSVSPYFNGKLILQLSPAADINDVIVSREKASDFKHWMGK
jgi:two-component system, LytTR family, response regulator LytT